MSGLTTRARPHRRRRSRWPVRARSRTRRSSRSAGTRCARSPCRCCPPGQDPLRDPAPLRPAPDARPAHARSTGCATWRRSTRTSWSTRATTGRTSTRMPALLRGAGAAPGGARRVRAGLERLRRADRPRTRPATCCPTRAERTAAEPAELPWRELASAVPVGRLDRPHQPPGRAQGRRPRAVARRHRRRAPGPRPVPVGGRRRRRAHRLGRRRPAPRRHARAVPPGARRDARRRRRPGHRRAHARRAARACRSGVRW